MTPPITPARSAGTSGFAVRVRASLPLRNRVCTRGTAKACSMVATEPDTGINSRLAEVDPTCSPAEANHCRVAATVCAVGPKVVANCPGARYWWYWGEPGVDTAVANQARA